jgi:hypothetical protein
MIVSTKLHIPNPLVPLVSRPGLVHKLNGGMKAKLTLVSAQAEALFYIEFTSRRTIVLYNIS